MRTPPTETLDPPPDEDGSLTRTSGLYPGAVDMSHDGPPVEACPRLGTERYSGFRHIARGGQGDVFEAFDQRLARSVAIKVLRPDRLRAADALRYEVGLMVGLEHPGIVPVHDRGETLDGRPWFAMQLLGGDDLGAVVERMRAGDAHWTPRRTLDVLARVAAAVGHAHQRGVVHCDLKPSNVRVGALGEVRVMDWGIARRTPRTEPTAALVRPTGTPGYMAPERYEAWLPDPRADVYSLGAILYLLLTGLRPGVVVGPPSRWRSQWPDGTDASPDLVALAATACAREPEDRPADGAAFARGLTDWLDGAKRRDEARAMLADADALRARWRTLRDEAADIRDRAVARLAEVGPLASAEAKRPGRALAADAEARAAEAELAELALVGTVQAALIRDPTLPGAAALLADHYRDVLLDAEAARDAAGVRRASALIRMHGDPARIEWLDGPSPVSLTVDAPEARVRLARYTLREGRLVPGPEQIHQAPLRAVEVVPGSYLAVLESPGRAPVRLPLRVERGAHWRHAPPGCDPMPVHLPPSGAIGPDEIYVPAGACIVGGDPAALDGLPRRRIWIDGFVIGRTAVTHGAWRGFLEDTLDRRGPAALDGLLPRPRDGASPSGGPIALDPDGRLVFALDDDGEPVHPDSPVALVDWPAATAYARWRAARDELPWRLPHDLEWEKAARGVDGRLWPWGDDFDPTWTRVAESFAGRPHPVPVGSAAADESPYGVRDMAGTIRTWCGSDYQRDGPPGARLTVRDPQGALRMVRGGAWVAAAPTCRPAGRFANRPDDRFRTIGVRLARSLPSP